MRLSKIELILGLAFFNFVHIMEQNSIVKEGLNILDNVANQILSEQIGRLQFNFTSGNYSSVDENILFEYIKKIDNLNYME